MKQLLFLFFILCSATVFAQDVIVKKDGSTILSKVLEVNQNEVKYKNYNNLNGPTYTISKSELQAINYQNGAKDTFSAPVREENRYLPNNQNDGTQKINDNTLIAMDYVNSNPLKKAKTLKTVGWIGGGILFLGGGYMIAAGLDPGHKGNELLILGISTVSIGVIGGALCIHSANKMIKKVNMLQSSSIYQKEFKLKNGSTFTPSVDILRDQALCTQTVGLGLSYKF